MTAPRKTKAGNTASAVACGAMMLSLPASSARASGPRIFPTPFAACPSPEERAPEPHAVLLDGVGREVREAALDKEGGGGDQQHEQRKTPDQHAIVISR